MVIKNCAVGMLKLEVDYRQTRSIARPLCDSWAFCFSADHGVYCQCQCISKHQI